MHNLTEVDEGQSSIQPAKETKSGASPTLNSNRKRGTLLTFWLVLLILVNAGETSLTIFRILSSPSVPLTVPLWANYTIIVSSVLLVVSAIAMLKWKKWGFYMYCAIGVLGFAVNLILGAGVFAFIGLIGIVITYLLLRSSWSLLE